MCKHINSKSFCWQLWTSTHSFPLAQKQSVKESLTYKTIFLNRVMESTSLNLTGGTHRGPHFYTGEGQGIAREHHSFFVIAIVPHREEFKQEAKQHNQDVLWWTNPKGFFTPMPPYNTVLISWLLALWHSGELSVVHALGRCYWNVCPRHSLQVLKERKIFRLGFS